MFTPRHSTSTDARFQKILTNSPIPKSVRKIYETLGIQQLPASSAAGSATGQQQQQQPARLVTSITPSLQRARDESTANTVIKRVAIAAAATSSKPARSTSIPENHDSSSTTPGSSSATANNEASGEGTAAGTTNDVNKQKSRVVIAKKRRVALNHARKALLVQRTRAKAQLPAAVTASGRDASGLRRSGRSSGPRDYWVLGSARKTPIYNEVVLRNYEKRRLVARNPELAAAVVRKRSIEIPKAGKGTLRAGKKTEKVEAASTGGNVVDDPEYDLSEPEG